MRRNLVYYICPFACNDEWRKNIIELKKYWSAFNGKKAITIAVGNGLCDYTTVKNFIAKDDVDYLIVNNSKSLGETAAFLPALEKVKSTDKHEISFYAHAKGVTPGKTPKELEAVSIWRNLMYIYCLSDTMKIDAVLTRYSCAGAFAKYGCHHLPFPVKWHFSGTFFWFNHNRLFTKKWKTIENNRHGVEGYLPQFFGESEMFCLFGNNPMRNDLHRYELNDWLQFYELQREQVQKNNNSRYVDYIKFIIKKIIRHRHS